LNEEVLYRLRKIELQGSTSVADLPFEAARSGRARR
jgi:hypothetical protein